MRIQSFPAALLTLTLAVTAYGCAHAPEADRLALGEARRVETPAWDGSGEPQLAVGANGRLYLSWIDPLPEGHALRFAVWEDDGWSAPRTVASGDDWFVNWADTPSMAALADGTLGAHWLVKSGEETYAYDIRVAVSQDAGETWSAPVRLHDDGTRTEHGFVTLVPDGDAFDVVWLDGRETASTPRGPMTLRHARLKADGAVGPGRQVDGRVCDCCPTDAARGAGGLMLAYRDRTEDEIRDIAVARFTDRWDTPGRTWADGWRTAACPVNGPALAARGDTVAVAWFTLIDGKTPRVRLAFSADAGKTFGEPVRIDDGAPLGRVGLSLLDDGTARVVWLERDGEQASIRLRDANPDSGLTESRRVAVTTPQRASGYPRIAVQGDRTVVAWTEVGDRTRVVSAVLYASPAAAGTSREPPRNLPRIARRSPTPRQTM